MHPGFVDVGIDSSDAYHDVCLCGPAGEPPVRLRIKNTLADFQRLLDEVSQRWPEAPCRFALENPRNLLGRFLLLSGQRVYALNPLAVASTRKGLAHSGAKSDALDAQVLAHMLRSRGEERLQPLVANSAQGAMVAGLVEQRQELVAEKVRLLNQLTAVLKGFYPRLLELFADLDTPTTLAALKAYPTPRALKQVTEKEWQAFLTGRRYPQPAKIPLLYQQAQAPQVPIDPVLEALGRRQVLRLVRLLEVLRDELRQVEQALAEAFEAHPDADFFRSLPGAAEVLAPSLLAVLGDNRERWHSWRQIAVYLGTAPITEESGKHRVVRMRFHCHRTGRQVLQQYAQASLRNCAWAKAYYEQQRQAGKTYSGALRSLANKWLRIMFRMWERRERYDEATYLAAVARRQGPQSGEIPALAA